MRRLRGAMRSDSGSTSVIDILRVILMLACLFSITMVIMRDSGAHDRERNELVNILQTSGYSVVFDNSAINTEKGESLATARTTIRTNYSTACEIELSKLWDSPRFYLSAVGKQSNQYNMQMGLTSSLPYSPTPDQVKEFLDANQPVLNEYCQ